MSGGSRNEGRGSVTDIVLFGGDGTDSVFCEAITLEDRLRAPGLRGDFPGDGIISSSTGGDSEAAFSFSCCWTLILAGLPGFLDGVLILFTASLPMSFFTPFLLNSTAVLLLTPGIGVEVDDRSD